jgi:hypothetical protein
MQFLIGWLAQIPVGSLIWQENMLSAPDQNYFTDRNLKLKTYPDHQYIETV